MCEGSPAKFATFVERLVKQSDESEYAYARNEWVPTRYWDIKYPIKCLCGAPIKKVLMIKNIFNGKEVLVGVSCAKEIILNARGFDNAIKDFDNIARNHDLIPNPAIPIFAYLKEYITASEYHFLIDMSRREWDVLTPKQKQWLRVVNKKMVSVVPRQELEEAFWPHYSIYR